MHVFICWSGARSRQVAEAIQREWLPAILGANVTAFLSTANIEPGEEWFDRLLEELGKAVAAIVCLTPENLASPWMHFEAGMVTRIGRGRVFTYFLGQEAPRLADPLAQIQITVSTEQDTGRLALKLAELAEVVPAEVEPRLKDAWGRLAAALQQVLARTMDEIYPGFARLFERKTFDEPLEYCADQHWLDRYEGARVTALALEAHEAAVKAAAAPWQGWLYDKLMHQVGGYVAELRRYLLMERAFDIGDSLRIDFGSPLAPAPAPVPARLSALCARRCREIRHVVACLSDERGVPVLPHALAFARLGQDQFADKKRLVHALGVEVRLPGPELELCARSFWDYDRIAYYLADPPERVPCATVLALVERELEKVEADDASSKMVLHYAVKRLVRAIKEAGAEALDLSAADQLVGDLRSFLDSEPEKEHRQLRTNVREIQELLERRRQQGS